LSERDGKNVVFVVKDNRARQTAIDTGGKIGDLVEVRSGPHPGDKVCTAANGQGA
jgi:hypothetical protein